MQNGQMKLTLIPPLPRHKMMVSMPKMYKGTAGEIPEVQEAQVFSLRAEPISSGPVRIDIDGEQPGILPAEFHVVPEVLNIRGLWPE